MSIVERQPPHQQLDMTAELSEQVRSAFASQTPLHIIGGDSKAFMLPTVDAKRLSVAQHTGVVSYEPTELVITARAGTPIAELIALLAASNQMLPFDPPRFDQASTLGGVVATGLSGPRRPWFGSVRDHVLGVRCIGGDGAELRFGGQVMKNVAGYDVSRLMTGALGTLGVITEVSLKVLPRPEVETTCHFECDAAAAIETCNRFSARALPISGACHIDEQLALRLSGTERGVAAAVKQIGGDLADANQSTSFWRDLRDWQHPGLRQSDLWRLSLPPATPPLALDGKTVTDWGGAQRWFTPSDELGAANIKAAAKAAGGYAYAVRGGNVEQGVTPPEGALQTIHTRLKDAFDPARIFNPGRVFATI